MLLKSFGLVLLLLVAGGLYLLYPRETLPAPPGVVAVSAFEEIPTPVTHRWTDEATFPFLGGAVLDVEGDGAWEVFVGGAAGQADALLAFQEGALVDRIAGTGLSDTAATYGSTAVDLDHDGDADLLVARQNGVWLYTNQAGRFQGVRLEVALPAQAVPFQVAVGDVEPDGDLDLYISAFVDIAAFKSATFNDPGHAKTNVLLRNDGTGFTDITAAAGVAGRQNTFTSAFVDLNGDRRQDLVLAQNTGEVEVFENQGNGVFNAVPTHTGFGFWMSLAVGDIDRDGDQDLFFSNAGNTVPDFLLTGDLQADQRLAKDWLLLRNDGNFRFTDVSAAYGLRNVAFAWGATFEDLNLDGALDLLVAQNYLKLPNFKLKKVPGKALMQLDHEGQAGFYHIDAWGLNNPYFGHAPLIADLNGDARPDVLWLNMNGPVRAFLNTATASFLSVVLPKNAATLGAQVQVHTPGGVSYTRALVAGVGFMTDQTPELTFGLGTYTGPVSVHVAWPDGTTTHRDSVAVNQRVHVKPEAAPGSRVLDR